MLKHIFVSAGGGDPNDGYNHAHVNDFNPATAAAQPWAQGGPSARSPLSPGHAEPPVKIECNCKVQCTYMMAKTQKNDGRWFYRSVVIAA